MKKQVLGYGLLACFYCSAFSSSVSAASTHISSASLPDVDLVIEGTTIISPIDKHQISVKANHWVAIEGNRISQIGSLTKPPKAKLVIDGSDQYLIPGLTDSHVHLKTMPGIDFSDANAAHMQSAFLARQGTNYLYYGVTQLIDPSNTKDGIKRFHESGLTPDAFFCGAMPVFNGYNAQGILHKHLHHERPYYLAQDTDPKTTEAITHAHQAKQSLLRLKNDGAVCAKVYIENGFDLADNIPMVSEATLNELTQYAKTLNLPTMAHANATDMQDIAANAEISVMGHGLWNWLEEQKLSTEAALPPKVSGVLTKILNHDIAYQPTLNVIRSLTDLMVEDHIDQTEYKTVLPPWQIAWYQSNAGQWFNVEMHKDWGKPPVELIIERFSAKQINGQRALKYLYDHGATILLGSDTPPAPTFASQPGLATNWELADMHKAGVDLKGILAAATINNANLYNLSQDYGTVEKGKRANLLLLNSNPLKTVNAYDDIDKIILRGQVFDRDNLHINKLEQRAPADKSP
ncbi:amidohydrolase family protein [Thalassotalea euphylliae]|uniref:Amidohydrolase n=1 Tax=Thalassotalea euphylliae TaxID=1655234 RepID=A0A3E0TXW3_9GAMM|nr:amidohydrolase family protein [Thalassotalea euphylliae]REL29319.1 amidohydrolase [Thalassotalea euphylliae]